MSKLEHIYKCLSIEIPKIIDQFWDKYTIPKKKLLIDVDNLQGLITFIISRMKSFPQMLINLSLIVPFLPEAVMNSNRAYYLTVL